MATIKSEEALFAEDTLCIFGAIDEEMTERILKKILSLRIKFCEECTLSPEVTVFICSPGGLVTGGLAIFDALRALGGRIKTVCIGQACSMGALLLSGGTKGYRFALPNSEIMIHQPIGGMQGQATDVLLHARHIARMKGHLNRLLSENTGQALKRVEEDTERDRFFTAEEARQYGLVDAVIESFKEVYPNE